MNSNAQTHNLNVINGYGSGVFHQGDTIHVWSKEYDNSKTFSSWTGDTQYLNMPKEWHTTLIMPNHDVSITAELSNMPSYSITLEQIMGKNNLKKVYSFFPQNAKGVIYFFHGTGGSAAGWIDKVEGRSLVNAAIADTFGIIVTEAEEITLNTDLNSDGKLRWQGLPVDTINGIDYLNMKAITDTMISRGNFNHSTPLFSIGMSNGGSFSALISAIYNYKAGISYCASSVLPIFNVRENPFAFRMAKYDDNAEVGPEGNYQAWQHDSIMSQRGICHDYEIHDRQPIYPERFARINGISVITSEAIFNELLNQNLISNNHYTVKSDTILSRVQQNPASFPTVVSLTTAQKLEILNQISSSNAEHNFYSDFNYESLNFFNQLCNIPSEIDNFHFDNNNFLIYPNPFESIISIQLPEGEKFQISIINAVGQTIFSTTNTNNIIEIDLSSFSKGLYFIQVSNLKSRIHKKIIKQ